MASFVQPPLTTVKRPAEEIGAAAAGRFPGTRFAAAGPGRSALLPGITHLTSIGMAISACTRVPATLDMEA
ncbi:hypothetical protein Drose_32680 [Dactylosporangium roseum]|uniref:Uncharacterized protein n=1 Tax=Dactylosporangium roseum TaxID=47989 RepID=A0ABY5Z1A0_9ACTN|nr:hypothetical protein [Dactylosporangium roseum]UWZ35801.1 hypothetical protein Drose_32680 [Dactylosporangium roseum]